MSRSTFKTGGWRFPHHITGLNMATALLVLAATVLAVPSLTKSRGTSAGIGADDVKVECTRDHMEIKVNSRVGHFSGLLYPKGLSRNSTCLMEFVHFSSTLRYRLPLHSCNTMSADTEDGGVEYFNVIVVQPHLKLVTNQGREYEVRCKFDTPEKIITFTEPINNGLSGPQPLSSVAELPGASMKIFYGDPGENEVAENVKIGDPLTLVVSLESHELFGLKVADCLVRDGLGWNEQRLINREGCPVDGEIMGMFVYSKDRTRAEVTFPAHKFPYTESVYYQCHVKLCHKNDGSCEHVTPPSCGNSRGRRQAKDSGEIPATIEVYSGLYVNEATDVSKSDAIDDVYSEKNPEDSICISQRNFAIGICIAGLILMLCVVLAIIILLARRRNKKTSSVPGSSIYSGPYTNTAYSHSS